MTDSTLLDAKPPAPAQADRTGGSRTRDLDRSMLHGFAWTSGAKAITQIFTWTSTFFAARLLSPDDYGLYGMAMFFLGLVGMLSDPGIGTAIIRFRDMTHEQVKQFNSIAAA